MTAPTAFDPTQFNFVLLQDLHMPGGVSFYENRNHPYVDGKSDFLRLNYYMTTDVNYVTIWRGLLELFGTEAEFENGRMASVELPDDFDLGSYNEDLFRGHIDSHQAAVHIFKALRIEKSGAHALPQVLTAGPDRKLQCECLTKPG